MAFRSKLGWVANCFRTHIVVYGRLSEVYWPIEVIRVQAQVVMEKQSSWDHPTTLIFVYGRLPEVYRSVEVIRVQAQVVMQKQSSWDHTNR